MSKAGFSLIELIVTMVIIGVILAIATLSFNTMQRKAQIESETRQLFAELNYARLQSIYWKKPYRITFQPTSYVLQSYSSDNEDRTTGGLPPIRTRNVSYHLSRTNGGSITNNYVEFNIRGGLTNDQLTLNLAFSPSPIYVNPVNSGAMFDCIVVNTAKTNLGQGVDSDNNGQPDNCNVK